MRCPGHTIQFSDHGYADYIKEVLEVVGINANNLEWKYYPRRTPSALENKVMKLVTKTRHGAKVYRVYDKAQTPYQRLLEAGVLTEAKQQELAAIYHGLNPVLLLRQINENLEHLWDLAERPAYQ